MAVNTITVVVTTPSDVTPQQVVDALAGYWGYQPTIPDPDDPGQTVPNPETDAAFVERRTAEFVGSSYTAALAQEGAEAGRQQGIDEAGKVAFEGDAASKSGGRAKAKRG